MEVFTNEYRFIGLFATTHGATIQNVTFVGGEVKAADCTFTSVYAGAVVGYARGTYIINCHNKGCAITVTRTAIDHTPISSTTWKEALDAIKD